MTAGYPWCSLGIPFHLSLFSQSTSLPRTKTNATFLNLNLAQAERGAGGGRWEAGAGLGSRRDGGTGDLVLYLPDSLLCTFAPSSPTAME